MQQSWDLDSVLFPPELCGISWLGVLGPGGHFCNGWRCQCWGWMLGAPGSSPEAQATMPLRKKCQHQLTPEIPNSGFQHVGRTHHRGLKPFHVSLAIRKWEAIYLLGEKKRLQFSVTTIGLSSSRPHYWVDSGARKSNFNIVPLNLFNWRASRQ